MENLPPTTTLLSNPPVVTSIVPGTNITVNKQIGDVTINSSGGGGATQTIVKYVESNSGGTLLLDATFQTVYTGTITTTAPNSLITATCVCNANSANPGNLQSRVTIAGVVASPTYETVILQSLISDQRTYSLQGAYRVSAPGTYTVNIQFTDPNVLTNTTMYGGSLIIMTNMIG
jgi:hypothetical protein